MIFYPLTLKADTSGEQDQTFMISENYIDEIEKKLKRNYIPYEKGSSLTYNETLKDIEVKRMISHLQCRLTKHLKSEWWRGTEVEKILDKKFSLPIYEEIADQIYLKLIVAIEGKFDDFAGSERVRYNISFNDSYNHKTIKLKVPHPAATQFVNAQINNGVKSIQCGLVVDYLENFLANKQTKNDTQMEDTKKKNKQIKIDNSDKPYIELE